MAWGGLECREVRTTFWLVMTIIGGGEWTGGSGGMYLFGKRYLFPVEALAGGSGQVSTGDKYLLPGEVLVLATTGCSTYPLSY